MRKMDVAEEVLRSALTDFPESNDLKATLADLQFGMKKFDDAETYFSKIKNEFPKSEEAKNIDIYIQRAQLAGK